MKKIDKILFFTKVAKFRQILSHWLQQKIERKRLNHNFSKFRTITMTSLFEENIKT